MICSADRQGPKFVLITEVMSKIFTSRLENWEKARSVTKLNPCAFFRLTRRDTCLCRRKSILNIHLVNPTDLRY